MTHKSILLVGTHHTPATELIKQLHQDSKFSWKIEYVGHLTPNDTHLQNTIIPKLRVSFHPLDSGKFDRRWLPNTIKGLPKIITALKKSVSIINQTRPDVVVSFGGYISSPIIVTAWLKHIPTITHEQTTTLSLSTRINSLFATRTALSFPPDHPSAKTIVTGNLLRSEIFQNKSSRYQKLDKKLHTHPLLFVTGGNQGSGVINQTLAQILPTIGSTFTIIHQTGPSDLSKLKHLSAQFPNYYPTDYVNLEDIGWVLHHAVVIVSRAGANYCQEIAALCQTAIFIPLPHSQQNEQLKNALWVKQQLPHTAIINQNQLTPKLLQDTIFQLSQHPASSPSTHHQPNLKLLDLIHEIIT